MSSSARPGAPAADPDDPLALAEYAPGLAVALTDAERWPTLDAAGAARLDAVQRHPLAPVWVHRTGDRLTAQGVQRAQTPVPVEGWLDEHLSTARRLPAYRRVADSLGDLDTWPTVTRDDLLEDVSAFVPLDADLDRMIEGSSSGTTGRALQIPDDIEEVARTFHLLVALVAARGIEWRPDPERMALAYVVHQRQAFTYASAISSFGQSTMARLNLHPSQWPAAGQRTGFLLAQQPQVITGNPTSLAELLHPDLMASLRPLALFSGAMALSLGLRHDLERAYGCPVIDVYGLHETRPIAASADGGPFVVLDRRVHVEVLDVDGRPAPTGQRGEIVVTAGENPLLPLVRYRTGDFGRLVEVGGRPALADLEGREATRFLAGDGTLVPSVDLTQQLQAGGARGWAVRQAVDGTVTATVVGGDPGRIGTALGLLLHRPVTVTAAATLLELGEGKPRRYESAAT
ncbi:AMP-binding protein [Cryobacterium sp. PAMC25264]|uniref:AMP-binding protein n=1 Tax=Cryobacterium sp. PAMC25264 TaxID=2861288 RepID=UPI001C62D755|nr:AMP-binding protein [Cryobacterium sp. PAMC25264]QYF73355.1 AMP-binding protein [Cryobacterium sp. PAMC25264]